MDLIELVKKASQDVKRPTPKAAPMRPRLVRGLTSMPDSDDAIRRLGKQIFGKSDPVWRSAALEDIKIEDVSGHGGSKTYKIALEGATPPALALHSRHGQHSQSPLGTRDML